MTPDFHCDCGARLEAIEVWRFCDLEPSYVPGPLAEPCTCPHCIHCGRRLEPKGLHPACINLDCPVFDLWQLVPA